MNFNMLRIVKLILRLSLFFWVGCFGGMAHALVLTQDDDRINLTSDAKVLIDKTGSLTIQDISADPSRFVFQSRQDGSRELSLSFTNAAYWIRLDLSRQPDAATRWILEIPFVGIDRVDWFAPQAQPFSSGTLVDLSEKQIFSRVHAFSVDLSTEPQAYYLRVISSYPLTIPLQLMRSDVYGREQLVDTMIQSLYFGGLLSLFFYNFVIFFTTRDRRYLLYCLFALFLGMGMYAGNGYGRLFLWPGWQNFDRVSQGFFLSLASGFGILFTIQFLELRQRQAHIFNLLWLLILMMFGVAVGFLATLFTPLPVANLYLFNFIFSTFAIVVCVSIAIHLSMKGHRDARYFVFSWGFLSIGAVTACLRIFDLVGSHVLTLYAVQIASGFEALFFSFALADRLRVERTSRELVQAQLATSQQEVVQALTISESRLEKEVALRTQELRASLVKEQQLRDQYVRFGAMIAHEFRNPLNVIETQNALFELDPNNSSEKIIKRVGTIRSAIVRLSSMFDQWLQSDRLSQAFTKISPLPIGVVGLLEDVIQTSSAYHSEHDIVTAEKRDSHLVIYADYGLLRIALLNLVDNACKYSPRGSQVSVGLAHKEGHIGLYVKDQGCGIPVDHQTKIFETYVRLPSAEKLAGVGLGLSFVKHITELHHGSVEILSQPDLGSTFILWIKTDDSV